MANILKRIIKIVFGIKSKEKKEVCDGKRKLSELMNFIDYSFSNNYLLTQALSHRSFTSKNNERLEFLGDSILNFIVAKNLFKKYPDAQEGKLTILRAGLVNEDKLVQIANSIGLEKFIFINCEEDYLENGRKIISRSILADSVEAIIGAVYLDSRCDIHDTEKLIKKFYSGFSDDCLGEVLDKDPKSELQELVQSMKLKLPKYIIVCATGENHDKTFQLECRVDSINLIGIGSGRTKQKAEQSAAKNLLDLIKGENIKQC